MNLSDQVVYYFTHLFSTDGFPARWHCGTAWDSFTGWLYIFSDISIWGAYFAIPLILSVFIFQKKNAPFPRIFWLFAAFIFACGLTHLMDAVLFWWPAYRLSGLIYFYTGLVSWATVFALVPVIKQAMQLKSPKELEEVVKQRTADLLRSQREIKANEARFRHIMDANIIGVVFCTFEGDITEANDAFLNMVGYTQQDLKEGRLDWKNLTPQEFLQQDYTIIEQAKQTGSSGHFEKQYFHKNGSRIDILASFAILPEYQNTCVALILDITAQKQAERALKTSEENVRQLNSELEQKVQERTAQLQEANLRLLSSNKELEAFSYSISHDLRAPLRSLNGYSQILLKEYANQLNEKAVNYLERIQTNSQKMGLLITHLLELAQVTRSEINLKTVNLSELCQEILDRLKEDEPHRKVTVHIVQNVEDKADPILIRSVLENLLGNAWKFTQSVPEPVIEFGVQHTDGQTLYFVKDNGVGFDMAYANKLFGVFQRLHTADNFKGTGIGLATVERIIHKHKGKIWAEAKENHGATFYFTLSP